MNHSIGLTSFRHIAWKEYRTLRDFWIACVAIGFAIQVVMVALEGASTAWFPAVFFPMFFALGAGGITFAAETEVGTDELLRTWASPPSSLLAGKLLIASSLTVALLLALFASYLGLGFVVPPAVSRVKVPPAGSTDWLKGALQYGLTIVGFFATAVLCSLIVKRTLNAIWIAAAVWLGLMFAGNLLSEWSRGPGPKTLEEAVQPIHILFLLAIVVADLMLGRAWIRRNVQWPRFDLLTDHFPKTLSISGVRSLSGLVSPGLWRGLLWREIRLLLPLGVVSLLIHGGLLAWITWWPRDQNWELGILLLAAFGTNLFLGVQCFHTERLESSYRFLAERAVRAWPTWFTKQAVRIPLVLISTAVLFVSIPRPPNRPIHPLEVLTFCLTPVLLYASGQFASILVSSAVLATFLGGVVSALFLSWLGMMANLAVPLTWTVLPIPAILLAMTWLRTGDLLAERTDKRSNFKFAGLLFSMLLPIVAGVIIFRVVQIPSVPPIEPLPSGSSAEAVETANIYRQACAVMKPMGRSELQATAEEDDVITADEAAAIASQERTNLAANTEAIALGTKASERLWCSLTDPETLSPFEKLPLVEQMQDLANVFLMSARHLEAEGRLDEALDRYAALIRMARHISDNGIVIQYLIRCRIEGDIREAMTQWAAHERQTPERIRKAIEILEFEQRFWNSLSWAVNRDYFVWRRAIRGGPSFLWEGIGIPPTSLTGRIYTLGHLLMPWEWWRSERLLTYLASRRIHAIEASTGGLAHWMGEVLSRDSLMTQQSEVEKIWLNTSLTRGMFPALATPDVEVRRALNQRALLLTLALYGYRSENGKFPDRMDNLIGPWLKEMPVDPYTGQEFGYRPLGFPNEIPLSRDLTPKIAVGQPVFWSAGSAGIRVLPVVTKEGAEMYQMIGSTGQPINFAYFPDIAPQFFVLP